MEKMNIEVNKEMPINAMTNNSKYKVMYEKLVSEATKNRGKYVTLTVEGKGRTWYSARAYMLRLILKRRKIIYELVAGLGDKLVIKFPIQKEETTDEVNEDGNTEQ